MSGSLAALVVATAVLVLIPGPNVALIAANTLQHGLRMGLATVLGTTVGVAVQLVIVVTGMATLVSVTASALSWIRWAGVVYLVWLGIRTWREPPGDSVAGGGARLLAGRGLLVAVLNPKTLLFNAAFIPQFVAGPGIGDFALVAGLFLLVLFVGDVCWALFAGSARAASRRVAAVRNRLTGAALVTAGIGLALARK